MLTCHWDGWLSLQIAESSHLRERNSRDTAADGKIRNSKIPNSRQAKASGYPQPANPLANCALQKGSQGTLFTNVIGTVLRKGHRIPNCYQGDEKEHGFRAGLPGSDGVEVMPK